MDEKTNAFSKIERRAIRARLTLRELCTAAEMGYATLWRAREGKLFRSSSWMKTARRLERKLDEIEGR